MAPTRRTAEAADQSGSTPPTDPALAGGAGAEAERQHTDHGEREKPTKEPGLVDVGPEHEQHAGHAHHEAEHLHPEQTFTEREPGDDRGQHGTQRVQQ